MDLYVKVMSSLERSVARVVTGLAMRSARHPWACVALYTLASAGLASGVLTSLRIESSSRVLWCDQNSRHMQALERTEALFPPLGRSSEILVTRTGDLYSLLEELMTLHEAVVAIRIPDGDGGELGLAELGTLVPAGPLRFWNGSLADLRADPAPLQTLALERYRGTFALEEVRRDVSMPGFSADEATGEASVAGIHLAYTLDHPLAMEWEAEFLEVTLAADLQHGVLAVTARRSIDDELDKSIGGDIILMVIAYILMITFACLTLGRPFSLRHGRVLLANAEVFGIVLSVGAAYGTAARLDVPFTSLTQVLPFILVGVGIDNAYVISAAFDHTDTRQAPLKRLEVAMRHAGQSITVTSMTDMCAFALASTSVMPAVQWFGYYACLSVLTIWLFHLTVFPALLVQDTVRVNCNRADVFLCRLGPPEAPDASHVDGHGTRKDEARENSGALPTWFGRSYANALMRVKGPVLVAFAALVGLAAWQATSMSTDFDLRELARDDSYLQVMYDMRDELFGTQTNSQPTMLILSGEDIASKEAQQQLQALRERILDEVDVLDKDKGSSSWLDAFNAWHSMHPKWAPRGVDAGSALPILVGADFNEALAEFLEAPAVLEMGLDQDVVLWPAEGSGGGGGGGGGGIVRAHRTWFFHTNTVGSQADIAKAEDTADYLEAVKADYPALDWVVFVGAGDAYIFFHQFSIIVGETVSSIGLSLVAVLAVCAVLLVHPLAIMLVLVVLAMIFTTLFGAMPAMGLALNSVSLVNLLMAVGLVVDFTCHVVHAFVTQDSSESRNRRVARTLQAVGAPVLLGISTTLFGVAPLAFASSSVFRVFFKMFLCICLIGGAFGLIFVPVLLSVVGPAMPGDHSGSVVESIKVHDFSEVEVCPLDDDGDNENILEPK